MANRFTERTHMHKTLKSTQGFTLVELAIALMVIGLLIGGVLKGQELIENARITATIRQIKAYDTAAMIFRNTYNALPGDIKRPNRIPNCTNDLCVIAGNGNGKLNYGDTSHTGAEIYNFFPHLTKAGMIQGPEGGTTAQMAPVINDSNHENRDLFFPTIPIDTFIRDVYYVNYSSTSTHPTMHYYYVNLLSGRQADTLDQKMDDGNPMTGFIHPDDPADCATYDEDTGAFTVYDIENGICENLMIGTGF